MEYEGKSPIVGFKAHMRPNIRFSFGPIKYLMKLNQFKCFIITWVHIDFLWNISKIYFFFFSSKYVIVKENISMFLTECKYEYIQRCSFAQI